MPSLSTDNATTPVGMNIITLQPGLLACYSTAQDIGAADTWQVFEGNNQFIHFNYQLAGAFQGRIGRRRIEFTAGEISCGQAAGERFHIRHCLHIKNIEVMVTPETLSTLAGIEACERLGAWRESGVFIRSARAKGSLLRSASTLVRLLTRAPNQRLRLNAATLEFLHWQLATFACSPKYSNPNAHERRLLIQARERLLYNLAHPPTIAELAQTIGMNQCRLKQAFKAQFGMTIYALFQHERMIHARELLHRHNVTETAGLLGYSNISHFSAAFRRQFGTLPSQCVTSKALTT